MGLFYCATSVKSSATHLAPPKPAFQVQYTSCNTMLPKATPHQAWVLLTSLNLGALCPLLTMSGFLPVSHARPLQRSHLNSGADYQPSPRPPHPPAHLHCPAPLMSCWCRGQSGVLYERRPPMANRSTAVSFCDACFII